MLQFGDRIGITTYGISKKKTEQKPCLLEDITNLIIYSAFFLINANFHQLLPLP
jgi:hypothetical protein